MYADYIKANAYFCPTSSLDEIIAAWQPVEQRTGFRSLLSRYGGRSHGQVLVLSDKPTRGFIEMAITRT
jgi:hypothetical protein